jgi:hypothetical protein
MKLCTDTPLLTQIRIYCVRVSVAYSMNIGQCSLQHEIFKEVPNHDIMSQMVGFPVGF